MRRFYHQDDKHSLRSCAVGELLRLTDEIFHHWCKVLRAEVGERAVLFDGTGGEYHVTLHSIQKKSADVLVDDFVDINRQAPLQIHLALVMSRGERMDYAIQKSCELGVAGIQLLISHHGEVRLKAEQLDKKMAHWQAVAASACEQCGLNLVPKIFAPLAFDEFVTQQADILVSDESLIRLILAVPNRVTSNASFDFKRFDKSARYLIVVGAEGGFSDAELRYAYQHDFLPWQIGVRVLRTESAPVVALASLQAWYDAKK